MNTLKTTAATRQNPGYLRWRDRYGNSLLLLAALLVSMISSTHAVNEDTKLLASDGAADDHFGNSVSVSGDRIVVGAHNSSSTYVYDWNGTQWLETKLTASDGAADDRFGSSVSVSGDRIVVGAVWDDDSGSDSGSAYVYDWNGTQWLETKLTASDGAADDRFGWSVSVSGDRIVVSNDSGSAYVYDWNGTQWLETKLTASDGAVDDRFGFSVSVSGDRIVVGALEADYSGSNSGSAYVYDWDDTQSQWIETKLTASDGAADDLFGSSVSVSGNRIVVGAYFDDDSGSNSGSAYVYDWDGTQSQWIETKLTASDGATDDRFGFLVSVSGNRIVVGALYDDDSGSSSGSVYIFKGPPTWLATNGTDLFLQDGRVAIGTDTVPTAYKLAVDGKIIAEEVTVELSANWPDYVFEDGYDLLSLDAVETHIANHKHLPNIPSSQDIEQTGLSMSKMFVMQMQKIEELTLYAIRQNKDNHLLQTDNQVLRKDIEFLKQRLVALEER